MTSNKRFIDFTGDLDHDVGPGMLPLRGWGS